MAKIISVSGSAETTTVKASITAVPGGAGDVLQYTAASFSALIYNTSVTAGLEYRVNSGAWNFVGQETGREQAINFAYDKLYFRQVSPDTTTTTMEISITGIPSINATVGDAVLSAVKITDTRKSPVMPARIHISMPTPPVATDGAAHTYDVQIPAKRAFYGVRFIDMNLNTAAVMNISASRVGSAPKHLNSNGAECLWNANLSTVKGATAWAVPAATAAVKANHTIPGFVLRDFEPHSPIARTDSATFGSNPLARVRTRIPAEVQYPYQVGAFATAWNAYAGNGGNLVGSNFVNTDFVNTYPVVDTTYTLTEGGGFLNPVMALFSYVVPGRSIFVFGDSLFQGVGSSIGNGGAANGFLGWPLLVDCQAPLLDVLCLAVSGQPTVDSMSTMKAFINALDDMPTYAAIKPYSPNDGTPTQAIMDAAWGRTLDGVSYLRTKGIAPILFTSPPVNAWNSTQHLFNEAQNARVVALAAALPWIVLIDMCAIIRDPANNRQILPAYNYDGTHYLTAGYQAIADAVIATLGN